MPGKREDATMNNKTIIHFEGKEMPANEWLDLVTDRQRRRKPDGETMAERWQRVKQTTYTRNFCDGKDDHGMSDFCNSDSSMPTTGSSWSMVAAALRSFFRTGPAIGWMSEPTKPAHDKSAASEGGQ
jgi:hypothetical protein